MQPFCSEDKNWTHCPRPGATFPEPSTPWSDAFSTEHPSTNGARKFVFPGAVFPWKNTFKFALQIFYNGFSPRFLGIFTGNNFDQPKYFTYLVSKKSPAFSIA